MTCQQLTEFIMDYCSDGLTRKERAEFEAHLAKCADCVRYLKSYEETIRLARGAVFNPDQSVPVDVPEELVRAILAARPQRRR